ncbi:hypothetical protein JCM8202v2_002720 [Rhodotorula sphaerocarpa]
MFHPTRGGTRGGQGDFKWSDVAADKDREYYLGHSLRAPVGRWQNNKDLTWYDKDGTGPDADQRERERQEELRRLKEAEEDALAQALGFAPTPRNPSGPTGSNAVPSTSTSTSTADPNAAILEKARLKAEKRAEHEARKAERHRIREERAAAKKLADPRHHRSRSTRHESENRHDDRDYYDSHRRQKYSAASPPTRDREGRFDGNNHRTSHADSRSYGRDRSPRGYEPRERSVRDGYRRREDGGRGGAEEEEEERRRRRLAAAFFEQFFQQQHAQQQAAQRVPSWDEQLEKADCPCPSRMDEKCIIPDGGAGAAAVGGGHHDAYVCARDCNKVKAAMHAFR